MQMLLYRECAGTEWSDKYENYVDPAAAVTRFQNS